MPGRIENQICSNICAKIPLRYPCAVICIIVIICQGVVLNYYLAGYKGKLWWLWEVADLIVCGIFIFAFVISFKHLGVSENVTIGKKKKVKPGGQLPLGYISWFIYSILLAVRVGIIFEDIAWQLNENDYFGPNTLKMLIATSGVVFWLLMATHHDAKPGSTRDTFIQTISHTVTFNLLDTVAILDILFIQESHIFLTFSLHRVINAIACVNFIIPTVPLIVLSHANYDETYMSKSLKILHTLLNLLFVNLPLFILRMYLWHALSKDISVFLIKNVFGIAGTFRTLWNTWLRPVGDDTDGKETEIEMEDLAKTIKAEDKLQGETFI